MLENKDFYCSDCGSTNLMFQAWVFQNDDNEFVIDELIDVSYASCSDCNEEVRVDILDKKEIKMKKENKILAINKPIQELSEKEVDEVIKELIKNGSLKEDEFGNVWKPTFLDS